jgi:hypothetical protein
MIYGTIALKNGKRKGRLEFDTGKIIKLSTKEVSELEQWIYGRIVSDRELMKI